MSQKKILSVKGRGAQNLPANRFLKLSKHTEYNDGIDEEANLSAKTIYLEENAKSFVNKVTSPDLPLEFSMNPYQGCEHGCVYCYARNSHEYYGYSAGIDFESKIIIKRNAAELLRKEFEKKSWKPTVIMLSGNTDCYQPAERKFEITRKLLETCLLYGNPISIITKNSLILRDLEILKDLSAKNLLHVNISITTLDEKLRMLLEPRTASAIKRLETVRILSENKIPVRVMAAPLIPFLNGHEVSEILKAAAEAGALDASIITVRLNGAIAGIFETWIRSAFPDKAERVLSRIKETHGGKLNDSRFGTRMHGEGEFAQSVSALYRTARKKYFANRKMPEYDYTIFLKPSNQYKLELF